MKKAIAIALLTLCGCVARGDERAALNNTDAITSVIKFDDSEPLYWAVSERSIDTDYAEPIEVGVCEFIDANAVILIAEAVQTNAEVSDCEHERYKAHSNITMMANAAIIGDDPGQKIDVIFRTVAPPEVGERMMLSLIEDTENGNFIAIKGIFVNNENEFSESRSSVDSYSKIEFDLPSDMMTLKAELYQATSNPEQHCDHIDTYLYNNPPDHIVGVLASGPCESFVVEEDPDPI